MPPHRLLAVLAEMLATRAALLCRRCRRTPQVERLDPKPLWWRSGARGHNGTSAFVDRDVSAPDSERAYEIPTADHAVLFPKRRTITIVNDDGAEIDIHTLHVSSIESVRRFRRKRAA